MDPIRYGFMETIVTFVEGLPPLLQFLLGVFITLAILKALIMVANFYQAKRDSEK